MGSLSHLDRAAKNLSGSGRIAPKPLCLLNRTHMTRRQPTTTPRRAPPTQPPHDGASGGVVGGSPSAQRTSSSEKRPPGLGSAARAEPSSRLFLPANFKVTHCRCHHSPITARVWPPLLDSNDRVQCYLDAVHTETDLNDSMKKFQAKSTCSSPVKHETRTNPMIRNKRHNNQHIKKRLAGPP